MPSASGTQRKPLRGLPLWCQAIDRAENRVGAHRLLRGVGASVTLGHRQVRMAEEHLHIDLTGTGLDRPGRKGVTEAVGMDTVYARVWRRV